ncbi:MAG: FAD-binding protein [Coriobacteriales bacterium]|jgi:fumarate reductase flavoprotein subunit
MSNVSHDSITRRSLVAGAAIAAGALGAAQATQALAADAKAGAASSAADAKAGASDASQAPSWLGEPPAISDDDCSEVVDTEILVAGAGDAGMVAAVSAAEDGAKVLLIDRMEKGFGIRCSALGAVDSSAQLAHDVHIDKTEIVNDVVRYADGKCDQRLWNLWANESGETIDWYTAHCEKSGGVKVELEWNMPEGTRYSMWPTGHGSLGTGDNIWTAEPTMIDYFIDYLGTFDGCEHRGYTKLERLIVEDGRVTGAYCSTGENFDSYIRVNASKGVIVATGGYVLNSEMMRALQPGLLAGLTGFFTSSQPYGDGIKACLWAGAQMEDTQTSMVFDRGLMAPDQNPGDPYTNGVVNGYNMSSQPWLKVDVHGNRFINESTPYDFVFHAASKLPNRAWYVVWDANYVDDADRFHTIGCSTQLLREGGDQMMGGTPESMAQQLQSRVDAGTVVQADTIEELAEKLGLDDVDNFVATVNHYNDLYDAQEDTDFGKEAFRLSAMREAPFYGMKMGGLALCTLSGVKVSPELEALDADGNPIEGLYVVGNDAGNSYDMSYPNYAAGLNAGRCATQGRHVARALAAK